jgi:hypothetical protein
MKRLAAAVALCLLLTISSGAQGHVDPSILLDLKGPVKTVTVVVTQISRQDSQAAPKHLGHERFTFDEKARVIEEELFNSAGVLENKFISTYDINGRKFSTTVFNGEGVRLSTTKYDSDAKGRLFLGSKTMVPVTLRIRRSSVTEKAAESLTSPATTKMDLRCLSESTLTIHTIG